MQSKPLNPIKTTFAVVGAVLVCLVVIVGLWAGTKAFSRYQKRADANNNVKVTNINIRKAQQSARIVLAQNATIQAKAEQRIIAARGLAKAQALIHSTLTPLYVQFEAIEAQKQIATSGKNNTVIYVPAGTNGTPIIAQDAKGAALTATPQG